MQWFAVDRSADAFQQPLVPEELLALCANVFGNTEVARATELDGGSYNTTYRVDFECADSVILRVAPAPELQTRSEHELLRNEVAALPLFSSFTAMMPRTVFADWSHSLVDRDYVFQSVLDGVPAAGALREWQESDQARFYGGLGSVARVIHELRGPSFGLVGGPDFATWSECILHALQDEIADLKDVGLYAGDLEIVAAVADRYAATLDEIAVPRLLHGDLWVHNVMVASDQPSPIVGIFDHDRAWWGDPAADWTLYLANSRAPWIQNAFRSTYGQPDQTAAARFRASIYRCLHLGISRMERHRHGRYERLTESYAEMNDVIVELHKFENAN